MPRFRGTRYPLLARRGLTSLSQLRGLTSWLDASYNVYSGGARQFYSADKTSLEIADNAALSTGDIDFTFAGWVYLDATTTTSVIAAKGQSSGSTREWALYLNGAGKPSFEISADGSAFSVAATWGSNVGTGGWHYVVGWHDATANTVNVQVDNGTAVSTATAGSAPTDRAGNFLLAFESALAYLGGRLAKCGFWKRTLTTAERTYLFNLGNGRLYAELGQAGTDGSALLTSLVSYWNLNEPGGADNALDAHSTNDLTPTFGELVTNGAFASDTSWTKGTGWTISGGKGNCDGTQNPATSDITQSLSLRSGASYSTSYTVSNYSAGAVSLQIAGTAGTSRSSNATFTETIAAAATSTSGARANATFVGSIDDLSIKATVIPAADGPASDVASDSIGSAHGTLTNFASSATAWKADVPTPLSGTLDTCLEFDGTNDYVLMGAVSAFNVGTGDFTVSGWVKSSNTATYQTLFFYDVNHSAAGVIIYTDAGTGALRVWVASSSKVGTANVCNGSWHHWCVSRVSGVVSIYVDGVFDTSATLAGSVNSASYVAALGWYPTGGLNYYLSGKESDIRFYTVGLNASQVQQLYAGTEATGATPTTRWKLDDGAQSGIGTGDPVVDWRTYRGTTQYQFLQSSASKRPLYDADAFGTGVPGIDGDGTDDILVCPTAFLSGTEGTVIVAYILDAEPNAYQVALASADEALTTKYMSLYGRGNTANAHMGYEQRDADTADVLDGSGTVSSSTKYIAIWRSNGTTITMRLNGVNQTVAADAGANNGDWWGDTSARDNTTLFGLKTSAESLPLSGKINKIVTSSVCLTDAECAEAERLIAAEIGVTL